MRRQVVLLLALLWLCCFAAVVNSASANHTKTKHAQKKKKKHQYHRVRPTDREREYSAERHRTIQRQRDGERARDTRRLQFEEIHAHQEKAEGVAKEDSSSLRGKRRKVDRRHSSGRHTHTHAQSVSFAKSTRSAALGKAVEDILLGADRYHMWWTGPVQEPFFSFSPEPWTAQHNASATHAVFTMAVIQGPNDNRACSSPNDLVLFLGSLRRVFTGDVVIALEIESLSETVKRILRHYNAVVYVLPKDLCTKESNVIFCGSLEERVPSTVFRYYFYEKWAALYGEHSSILLTDFRDVVFQANPFTYRVQDWSAEHHLAVFQEFYPNMVIERCRFNKQVMRECYGEEALRQFGRDTIISSGAIIGTRDAIVVWTHHMTLQLQEAPGRMLDTRCSSGGIDHGFVNWLVYGKKLRQMVRVRVFAHGEGAVNSLGGLRPDTVHANITGSLQSFWKLLTPEGNVVNWNGDVSPVVHQLDHFQDELLLIADRTTTATPSISYSSVKSAANTSIDRMWQVLPATRCLFGCADSVQFG